MSAGSEVAPKGRRMIFPYTWSARIAQFPYQLYWRHWMYRYLVFGMIGSYPVWLWINSKVNSPAAKAAHAERLRKEAEAEHHH